MSIQKIEIELLPINDHKYLRTIILTGKDWNKFTGFVSYYRDHNIPLIDDLDKSIIDALKSYSVNAEIYTNYEIYMVGQAQDILNRITGSDVEDITMQLNPKSREEVYKQALLGNVYYYPKKFKAQIFKGHNYSGINNYVHAFLEYKTLEDLIKTIHLI